MMIYLFDDLIALDYHSLSLVGSVKGLNKVYCMK